MVFNKGMGSQKVGDQSYLGFGVTLVSNSNSYTFFLKKKSKLFHEVEKYLKFTFDPKYL